MELPFGAKASLGRNSGVPPKPSLAAGKSTASVSAIKGNYFSIRDRFRNLSRRSEQHSKRGDTVKEGKPRSSEDVGPGKSFFDPFVWASQSPMPASGLLSFNSVQGPGTVNLDFGLFRTFRLSEHIQMQFRAEAFNFTNTPHFANPSDAQATISTSSAERRRHAIDLVSWILNAVKGTGREGVDERVFRLGVRLSF